MSHIKRKTFANLDEVARFIVEHNGYKGQLALYEWAEDYIKGKDERNASIVYGT